MKPITEYPVNLILSAARQGYDDDFRSFEKLRQDTIIKAEINYCSDDIQIATDADISICDHGVWIQAWLWVPDNET